MDRRIIKFSDDKDLNLKLVANIKFEANNMTHDVKKVLFIIGIVFCNFASAISFTGVGQLPNGGNGSNIYGISADGNTAVGLARIGTQSWKAVKWTVTDKLVILNGLSGLSYAMAASGDGSIIVGSANSKAFRWTQAGVTYFYDPDTGYSPIAATGISDDGKFIAAHDNWRMYRFSESGPTKFLQFHEGAPYTHGISPDGSTVTAKEPRTKRAIIWKNGDSSYS